MLGRRAAYGRLIAARLRGKWPVWEIVFTGHEDLFEAAPDNRSDEQECMQSVEQTKHRVNRLLEYLDPRERQIIRMRAGLDDHSKAMTLEEIGKQLGITKERVRQLNVRIMNKLRSLAKEQKVDDLS